MRGVFVLAFRCKIIIRSRKGEGMDEVGVKVWVFVATVFILARNIVILQKNKKTEKTHQVFKKFTCRTSKDPRQKISLMYHIFFYSPLARQKGGGSTLPPPPAFVFIFCSHPTLGGYVAPYFYPVDNGYPSGVTSHSKK